MPSHLPAVGEKAPEFNLPNGDGGMVARDDLSGSLAVLFFYPKDDTPGCTREACEFSADLAAFEAAGAKVFGVSRDPLESHKKFTRKHGLTVPLLSDIDGTLTDALGIWVEKNMYGRKYMGLERTTVLIGRDGTILEVWNKVKVPDHVAAVLARVQAA